MRPCASIACAYGNSRAACQGRSASKTGLPIEQIGVFLSPCAAKVTDIKLYRTTISHVDGAIAISEIYHQLADAMKHIEKAEPLSQSV
ncbi:MAG: hypothetical protein ACLSCV_05535 [Acutalibacteraceae bacterium]